MELWPSALPTSSGMCSHTGSSVVSWLHGTRRRLITSQVASKGRQGSKTSESPLEASRMLDGQTGGLGSRVYCKLPPLCVTTKVSTTRGPLTSTQRYFRLLRPPPFLQLFSLVSFSSSLARLLPCSVGARARAMLFCTLVASARALSTWRLMSVYGCFSLSAFRLHRGHPNGCRAVRIGLGASWFLCACFCTVPFVSSLSSIFITS
jgi:hypothetical protein